MIENHALHRPFKKPSRSVQDQAVESQQQVRQVKMVYHLRGKHQPKEFEIRGRNSLGETQKQIQILRLSREDATSAWGKLENIPLLHGRQIRQVKMIGVVTSSSVTTCGHPRGSVVNQWIPTQRMSTKQAKLSFH